MLYSDAERSPNWHFFVPFCNSMNWLDKLFGPFQNCTYPRVLSLQRRQEVLRIGRGLLWRGRPLGTHWGTCLAGTQGPSSNSLSAPLAPSSIGLPHAPGRSRRTPWRGLWSGDPREPWHMGCWRGWEPMTLFAATDCAQQACSLSYLKTVGIRIIFSLGPSWHQLFLWKASGLWHWAHVSALACVSVC